MRPVKLSYIKVSLIHKNINITVQDKCTLHQSCVNGKGPITEDVGGKWHQCYHLNTLSNYSSGNRLHHQDEIHVSGLPGVRWNGGQWSCYDCVPFGAGVKITSPIISQAREKMKSGSSSVWLEEATAGWRELTCGDSLPPEGKRCPGLDGMCRNWTVIIRTRPPGQRGCGISDFFYMDAGGGPRGTW